MKNKVITPSKTAAPRRAAPLLATPLLLVLNILLNLLDLSCGMAFHLKYKFNLSYGALIVKLQKILLYGQIFKLI